MRYISFFGLLFIPSITFAQGLEGYFNSFLVFINNVVFPLLLGIGFLFLIINIVRYFIIESTNPEGRETAKIYIIYSILAFLIISVFWGIMTLLVNASGLGGVSQPVPDFIGSYGGGVCPPGSPGSGGGGASGCGSGGGGGGGW